MIIEVQEEIKNNNSNLALEKAIAGALEVYFTVLDHFHETKIAQVPICSTYITKKNVIFIFEEHEF